MTKEEFFRCTELGDLRWVEWEFDGKAFRIFGVVQEYKYSPMESAIIEIDGSKYTDENVHPTVTLFYSEITAVY